MSAIVFNPLTGVACNSLLQLMAMAAVAVSPYIPPGTTGSSFVAVYHYFVHLVYPRRHH